MKLQRRPKSAADLKRSGGLFGIRPAERAKLLPHQQDALDHLERSHAKSLDRAAAAVHSPQAAHAAGVGYSGPEMPDKGKKDGSCNRTACQMPLAGKPQFWMRNHMITDGRHYYCRTCERAFAKWDRIDRPNEPPRCTPDEGNAFLARDC
jgi:hypothetical protein